MKNIKNKGGASQQGPYKKFLTDLHELLHVIFGPNRRIAELSNDYQHMLFDYKYVFQNPKAHNEHVTSAELKIINDKSRKLFVERNVPYNESYLSNYQLHLLWCYSNVKAYEAKRKYGEDDPDHIELKKMASDNTNIFFMRFLVDYFKVITQLSSPDHKYFGVKIRPAALFRDNPKMEIVVEVYGFLPQTNMFSIDGRKRIAFRLAMARADIRIKWISIESLLVGNNYRGDKLILDVYIQSHALKRFRERLDVLNSDAINYLLWENTHTITKLEMYRGLLLLPILLFEVKIGYMAAKVVDDKLLFTTFLFLTHSCTPEGDRLKKITGLGKQDISYWHIDRLSTFINLQTDRYPQLIELFDEAGIGDMKELKHKKFDIDSLQDANLEALLDYITKNKVSTF